MIHQHSTTSIPANSHRRRSGVVTFELIIWLPVLIIFLLALIEFGQIYALNKIVQEASRYGAKIASETSRIDLHSTGGGLVTSGSLTTDIQQFLLTANVQNGPCSVTLVHNACLPNQQQQFPAVTPADCRCPAPGDPANLPGGEPPAGEAYVQVTVCVRLENNVPNLLDTFGFDVGDCTLVHTTTLRYEEDNEPPNAVLQLEDSLQAGVSRADGGGTLPVACPTQDCNIVLEAVDGTAPDPITLSFNGLLSNDPDDNLQAVGTYQWNVTVVSGGGSVGTNNGTGGSFSTTFDRPDDPADANMVYDVSLTVTDTCNVSDTETMRITIDTVP